MKKKITLSFISLIITIITLEIIARVIVGLKYGPDEEAYLSMKQNEPRYIAQPFLNYINNPRFKNKAGKLEFNKAGIRNDSEIIHEKNENVYRILFLGGSTTFGMIEDGSKTFPMLIEKMLNDSTDSLSVKSKRVECLNAGLCGGTSAEILTHYLLKLNYFKPDMIVVHSGINDAITYMPLASSQYHPDYHNRRTIFPEIKPLSPILHILMKSEAISLMVYFIKYWKYIEGGTLEKNLFFSFNNENEWLISGNDSMFSPRYNAFYNNYKNLATIALANNQKVVFVTEVVDREEVLKIDGIPDSHKKVLDLGFEKNNSLLEQLSVELNVSLCKLKEEDFPPQLFIEKDPIHVNEEGEMLKARFIRNKIIETLSN